MNLRQSHFGTIKNVFLAGEGQSELGGWFKKPPYQNDEEPGVLKTLLHRVKETGWQITNARSWKSIKKYRAGEHRSPEERNVLGVCLEALEQGCSVIAFTRDSDGERQRKQDVDNGIEAANDWWGIKIGIIGGCAEPCIEGWILAILGTVKTERLSAQNTKDTLARRDNVPMTIEKMVSFINKAGLENIARDAISLKNWLASAEKKLGPI